MNLLAVFVGGLIGCSARLGIDALLPHTSADAFPWSTLIINVIGSFVLGLLVARVWPTAPDWLRYGLGTGVLGSFTTFSAVVVSLLQLTGVFPMVAAVYLLASLVLGLGAAWLGLRVGGRRRPARITADE
jgi:CrcB protein